MNYRLGYMLGDGIGPEIVPAARKAVDEATQVAGAKTVDWVELPMGAPAIEEYGSPMPESNKEVLTECHGWLLGPFDNAIYPVWWRKKRERVPGGELRHYFDLYANIRPARNRPGAKSLVDGVDIVTVRENTEGFYADRNMAVGSGEFMPTPDTAMVVGVFKRSSINRIARTAFEIAQGRRKRVTIVHKSNVIPLAFGLFLEECHEVARGYPDVEVEEVLFDAMTAHLVRHPQRYDVLVTENLFGDTLSDLAGELVGALGMSGALNAGDSHAMAQAAHGSAPDIAGQGIASPIGMMLSAAQLLGWLGDRQDDKAVGEAGFLIERSIDHCLGRGIMTVDLGGSSGTEAFTQAVLRGLEEAR